MNVCVVGYGMMGVWHSEALAEQERYFLVGRRPEATGEFAARYGYRRWSVGLEEALADPAVDAVIVASPSELHAAMALRCLAHGDELPRTAGPSARRGSGIGRRG